MNSPTLVQVVAALLTPAVAIVGIWIAIHQTRIQRNKLKLERFDRRFAIFEAAMVFVSQIAANGIATEAETTEFLLKTRGSRFMVGEDVSEYLNLLRKKSLELQLVNQKLHGRPEPTDEERARYADHWASIEEWFQQQLEVIPKKFEPYLVIAD